MRVHHINCGTMCPIGGPLMYGARGGPDLHRLVCHCLAIETDRDGIVLVDTGLGLEDVRDPGHRLSPFFRAANGIRYREEETALRMVERLGLKASDVRHIVLTHLDFDHAGGIEDFPNATVHLHAPELEAARGPRRGFIARNRYSPRQWDRDVRWRPYEAGGEPWFGFEAVRGLEGLPPEVLLVPLVGHTAGHSGVAVDTGSGWLLHAGDAYFHEDELRGERPRCPPLVAAYERMMEVDRASRLANRDRLRGLAREHGGDVRILCSHDPAELARAGAARADAHGP